MKSKKKNKKQYGLVYVKPGYKIHGKTNPKEALQLQIARDLRQKLIENATYPELVAFRLFKQANLPGLKFQDTTIINGRIYFPDFSVCIGHRKKLYIEFDGGYHNTPEQLEKDFKRTIALTSKKGNKLIRFVNEDILERPEEVLATVQAQLMPSIS